MQWTEELNALLNQCVFECGYDFTAASALLLNRARQLRLVSADERITLTNDDCQVQWMEINPVVEDDDEYNGGDPSDENDQHDVLFRRAVEEDFHIYQRDQIETAQARGGIHGIQEELVSEENNEIRPVEALMQPADDRDDSHTRATPAVAVPPGCPKLELSLSDDDLDALLSSLPAGGASRDAAAAEAKQPHASHAASSSEMQWVLSFLTDPDAVAHQDAEAKNLLFENIDKAEHDNYQYFLQELGHANLLSPQKPNSYAQVKPDASSSLPLDASSQESEDEDSEDDDWRKTRKTIKTSAGATPAAIQPTAPTTNHKRRPLPRTSHLDVDLPPAAPIRFPPRNTSLDNIDNDSGSENDDLDDNGLDALPRYSPPEPLVASLRAPLRDLSLAPPMNSAKRLALSQEIGQQLREHGQFQFPKRLFRDVEVDDTTEGIEQEVTPEAP